jgi:type I restriction enzyme S subunit
MSDEVAKNGWTRVAFGDVVRQVRDRVDPEESSLERYIAGEHMDTDDLRIRRWGRIGDGYLGPAFHMRFKPGQVLYGSRRTYLRKVAVADFEGVTANTTFVLESKNSSVLLPDLLPFIMQTTSFHEHAIKESKGSVNPYINFSDLCWYSFGLPPLLEQRRIAALCGAVQNVIEALTRVLRTLEFLQRSCEKEAFEQVDVPTKEMRDFARLRSGKTIGVSGLPRVRSSEHPVSVFGGNGIAGFTTHALSEVPVPVVVVGRVGEYCGAVYLIREPAWVTDNALFVSELDELVDPAYLAICLKGARLNRLSSGGAQPLLNQKILGDLAIPITPLDIQHEIVLSYEAIVRHHKAASGRLGIAVDLKTKALAQLEA